MESPKKQALKKGDTTHWKKPEMQQFLHIFAKQYI